MLSLRNFIILLIIYNLIVLPLCGCNKTLKSSLSAAPQKQDTYSIDVADYTEFDIQSPVIKKIQKTLADDDLIEEKNQKRADWPMRLVMVDYPVEQLSHSRLGSPTVVSSNPISCFLSTLYLVGWTTMEVGKGAINAGTPDYIVKTNFYILDSKNTIWRIDDEISLRTPDKKKIAEYVAREASSKVKEYLEAFREGKQIEKAIKETDPYRLDQFWFKTN